MTDTVEIAWIGLGGALAAIGRDVWVRCRTDRKEAQERIGRLGKEAGEREEKRRLAEDEKALAVAEAEKVAVTDAALGWLSVTDREHRDALQQRDEARHDRDEARENVNVLRLALEGVIGELTAEIGRMRRELQQLRGRRGGRG